MPQQRIASTRTRRTQPSRTDGSARTRPAEWTDAELIRGIRAGSQRHFDALYERYFDRIYGFVYKRVGSHTDAEEIVQECFIAVYTSFEDYRAQASLVSWIYGIARNTTNNQLRRAVNQRRKLEEASRYSPAINAGADISTPEEQLHLQRFAERVRARLAGLSEWQREIFALRHFDNLSIPEIVDRTNRSSDSVRSSLCRVKRLLTEATDQSCWGESR